MTRGRVIGCGNPDAGDDAVGLLAVRAARLALEDLPDVDVVETGAGAHIVDLLRDVDAAVIVDAVRDPAGGRAPGTLVRIGSGSDGQLAEVHSSLSSHGFGVAEAVGLAAAIGSAPAVVFLGLEVEDVTAGHPLSPALEGSLPELVTRVVAEVWLLSSP